MILQQPASIVPGRLTRRPEFLAVSASGVKAVRHSVIMLALRRPSSGVDAVEPLRVGFTATRKLGNAVIRNRAKRRLREAARKVLPQHGQSGFDYVLIGRAATLTCSFDDLILDVKHALKRLHANTPPPG